MAFYLAKNPKAMQNRAGDAIEVLTRKRESEDGEPNIKRPKIESVGPSKVSVSEHGVEGAKADAEKGAGRVCVQSADGIKQET